MKFKSVVVLQAVVSLSFFLSLVFNMIGIFGASWLTIDESTEQFPEHLKYFGVIRICQQIKDKAKCFYRNDVFQFKYLTHNEAIILDMMFLALLGSTSFCFIALNGTFLMLKCQQKDKYLKCGTIFTTILSLFSIFLELAPVIYLKVQIPNLPQDYKEGWTFYTVWVAVGLQVICTAFCFVMISKLILQKSPERSESPSSTLNYPLERYFYGASKSKSMKNFNERWFDERYSTTASNGYAVSGYTNDGYQVVQK